MLKQYWLAALLAIVLVSMVVYTSILKPSEKQQFPLSGSSHEAIENLQKNLNQKLDDMKTKLSYTHQSLMDVATSLKVYEKKEGKETPTPPPLPPAEEKPKGKKFEEIEVEVELTQDELKTITQDFAKLTAANSEYCYTAALPKNRKKVKKMVPVYEPSSVPINELAEGEEIEEAFVAFVTPGGYVELMRVVVQAVHEFSTRPIILYGFDMENPFSNEKFPRLKFVKAKGAAHSTYFNKIKSVMLSRVKYGVLLEADSIPNWKVDDLFLIAKRHATGRYPLLPRHPSDPHNQLGKMKEMGITCKAQDYGHAHLVFTYHNLQFFNEVHEQCIHGDFTNDGMNWDETAINVNLWLHRVNKQACTYDSDRGLLPLYINQELKDYGQHPKTNEMFEVLKKNPELAEKYIPVTAPMGYLIVHGNKDVNAAKKILEDLKANKGKPVYTDGKIWTNDLDHPAIRGCIVETSPNVQ